MAISLAPGKEVDLNKTGITITVNGFNQETNENIDIEVEGDSGEENPEPPTPPVTGDDPTITIPQALYTLPADEQKMQMLLYQLLPVENITVAIKGGNELLRQ